MHEAVLFLRSHDKICNNYLSLLTCWAKTSSEKDDLKYNFPTRDLSDCELDTTKWVKGFYGR